MTSIVAKSRPMAVAIAQITSGAIFKGIAIIIVGVLAVLFANYMKKKWNEPKSFWFDFFLYFSYFIIAFGLYVLLFRPNWWALPY